jgi:hypothetical protein
MCDIASNK